MNLAWLRRNLYGLWIWFTYKTTLRLFGSVLHRFAFQMTLKIQDFSAQLTATPVKKLRAPAGNGCFKKKREKTHYLQETQSKEQNATLLSSSGKRRAPEKRILYKHVNLRTALKCLTAWAPQKIVAREKPELGKTMPYEKFPNPPPRNIWRNAFGQNAKQLPLRLLSQTESKRMIFIYI